MIEVIQGDITRLAVDAIVNAANSALAPGGGVDGAIHAAAGPGLLAELAQYDGLRVGEALVTKGYGLPAKYIVHTVGPVWRGGKAGEPELLRRAYQNVVQAARRQGDIRSIAFPAISTGVYGFPMQPAAYIAISEMKAASGHFARIVACAFDAAALAMYQNVVSSGQP